MTPPFTQDPDRRGHVRVGAQWFQRQVEVFHSQNSPWGPLSSGRSGRGPVRVTRPLCPSPRRDDCRTTGEGVGDPSDLRLIGVSSGTAGDTVILIQSLRL